MRELPSTGCKPIGGRTAFLQAVLRKLEVSFKPRDRSPELLDRMAEACQTTRVLVIDEADRAHDFGMEIIRYCLAQATNRTTFVLVGWKIDSLVARNPALDSRIAWRHEHQPLEHEASSRPCAPTTTCSQTPPNRSSSGSGPSPRASSGASLRSSPRSCSGCPRATSRC